MANTSATSPGTMADDATVGTVAWNTPDNAKVSDNVYTTGNTGDSIDENNAIENSIKIVKGGNIGGDEKSTGAGLGAESYKSYGGSSILWGLTWTADDINNSTFGVVFSAKANFAGRTSHYLKATNFGFSIPTGATINGILVGVESRTSNGDAQVDHIRITIYYTEAVAGTNMQINIGDAWKSVSAMKINIGDAWKDVAGAKVNIGDAWKTIF